ncbi:uncharacterized protein [Pyrus communis]|uniref:uncharacterized protein n=1 Tax=Pyrus communis TaxID=23211 RepID=UPI0035C0D0C6
MAEESSINLEGESSFAATPTFSDIDVNPNQRLSSVLLNEFNYLPWERVVTLALGGRSKLGYVNEVCYNPKTNKIVVSRDVKFEASPYFTPSVDSSGQGDNPLDLLPIPCLANVECPSPIDGSGQEENHASQVLIPNQGMQTESSNTSSPTYETSQVSTPTTQVRRNPAHERNPPLRLLGYVTYNARYPLAYFITYDKFSSFYATFLSALNGAHEPQSFQEANLCDEWKKAMAEEIQAFHENQTWCAVKLPKGKKDVGSR